MKFTHGSEPIDLHADTLDSREIQARIEWLETEIEALDAEIGDNPHPDDFVAEREELTEHIDELDMLVEFRESLHADGEWKWGITFIRDHYFEEFAKEYAEDTGVLDCYAWPMRHIRPRRVSSRTTPTANSTARRTGSTHE